MQLKIGKFVIESPLIDEIEKRLIHFKQRKSNNNLVNPSLKVLFL